MPPAMSVARSSSQSANASLSLRGGYGATLNISRLTLAEIANQMCNDGGLPCQFSGQVTCDGQRDYQLQPTCPVVDRGCAFWDEVTKSWRTEGCTHVPTDDDTAVACQCNHLTDFVPLEVRRTETPDTLPRPAT